MNTALLVCLVLQTILMFIGLISGLISAMMGKTDVSAVCLAFAAGLLLSVTIVAYLP